VLPASVSFHYDVGCTWISVEHEDDCAARFYVGVSFFPDLHATCCPFDNKKAMFIFVRALISMLVLC
jgi:hypothetical protein